jgi:DNA-binding PadR family transcriptional regulator
VAELTKKQKTLLDFLSKRAANGALKMVNHKIAEEMAAAKLVLPAPSYSAISTMLKQLEKKGAIRIEHSGAGKDRVIYILG